jgi:hypothetical protein
MIVSLILIVRQHVCAQIRRRRGSSSFAAIGAGNLSQQTLQIRKRYQINLWMLQTTNRRAGQSIKHPQRQLKRQSGCVAAQLASRDGNP